MPSVSSVVGRQGRWKTRKRATGAMPRLGRRPFAAPHGCWSEVGQVRPRAASRVDALLAGRG